MEKIKLPTALAHAVWKDLEKKGVQPRKNLAIFMMKNLHKMNLIRLQMLSWLIIVKVFKTFLI